MTIVTDESLQDTAGKRKIQLKFHSKVMLPTMQKLVIMNNITNIIGGSFIINVFRHLTDEEDPGSLK